MVLNKFYLVSPTTMNKFVEIIRRENEQYTTKKISKINGNSLPNKDNYFKWKELQQKIEPKLLSKLIKTRQLPENDLASVRQLYEPSLLDFKHNSDLYNARDKLQNNMHIPYKPHRPLKIEENNSTNKRKNFDISDMSIDEVVRVYNLNRSKPSSDFGNIEENEISQKEDENSINGEEELAAANISRPPPSDYPENYYSPVSKHTRARKSEKRAFELLTPVRTGESPLKKKNKNVRKNKDLVKEIAWKPYNLPQ